MVRVEKREVVHCLCRQSTVEACAADAGRGQDARFVVRGSAPELGILDGFWLADSLR